MRAKRICATILCAAMLFSSEGFTMNALADEIPEAVTSMLMTESREEGEEPEEPQASILPEETETPSPDEMPEETPDENESPVPSPTPSALPEETMTPEVSPEPLETPDIEETPSPSETPSEIPFIEMEESVSPTPSMTPENLLMQDEIDILKASNDCFEVDENGRLGLKAGEKITTSTVSIPENVKIIPAGIFNDNSLVTKVLFDSASQLTTIEAGAFENSLITSIDIPTGVTEIADSTFKRSALKSITFKGAVTSIGREAFMGTAIEEIDIPNVTSIGNGAFSNCQNLTTVINRNLQDIGAYAFENCKSLGSGMLWSSGLLSIGRGAFYGCGFTILNMSSVKQSEEQPIVIDVGAFENCADLRTAILPDGLLAIPASMFKDCGKLSDVSIKQSTNGIGGYAFGNCVSLKRIVLPEGVSRIEARAFDGCSALNEIIINYPDTEGEDFYIAENAFPVKSNVTMKGYDGYVQEYAENKGYKFETLYEKYGIEYVPVAHAKLAANVNSAVPGTEVTFTITTEDKYCLMEGSVSIEGSSNIPVELVSCTGKSQVYRFVMPKGKATIKFQVTEIEKAINGKLSYELIPVGNQPVTKEDGIHIMKKTGQEAQLSVNDEKGVVGAWLFNYTSSNTKVVSISDTGRLQACGKGEATITATLRSNSNIKIKFKMKVKEDASITSLEIDIKSPYRARVKEEEISGKTYKVVEYNKATLNTGNMTFNVSVNAYEESESNSSLIVATEWKSIDSSIASVAKSKSMTNSNTITVKKGVEGETMITVSVKNAEKNETIQESFIIRVVNATPRLANAKIAVNSLSDVGTAIDVVPVYGYEIEPDGGLEIHVKTEKNGIIDYDKEYKGLTVSLGEDGKYYIKATEELALGAGKSITFKGKTQLYLWGRFDDTHASFVIPISELTVTNKALNPTVKLSGKINLFYNSTAQNSEKGVVTLTQSLKAEKVDRYELVSDANYKKPNSEEVDSFAANFTITKTDDNQKAEITRTSTDMVQVNKKNVVSGYVYIYYEGYTEPIKRRITIPTCNTVPSYILSSTSATASVYRSNQVYSLQILDKKTKKPISLADLNNLNYDYNSTTEGLFEALDIDEAKENDTISVKVDGKPANGKAVIYVKLSTWSQAMRFTFNLKTTKSLPIAKLSASSMTLNKNCPSKEAKVTYTINQKDAWKAGFDEDTLLFTGSKTYAEQAAALMRCMEFGEDSITVALPKDKEIRPMTYSFKVKPRVGFEENAEEKNLASLAYVSFKVVVSNKKPVIKLKNSTFTLNATEYCAGEEKVSTTYSITGLPANSEYEIDDSEVKLVPVSKTGTAPDKVLEGGTLSFPEGSNTITAVLKDKVFYSAVNCDYYVEGLKLVFKNDENDETVVLDKFRVKIKGVLTKPTVKVTAKGTINPVNSESRIEYTAKVSNIVSSISDIDIYELNPETGNYYIENGKKVSEHFAVERDEKNVNKAIVRVKDGVVLDSKITYKIRLVYSLEAAPDMKPIEVAFNIKPKQTLPKIKTNKTEAYLYAGQRPREVQVKIEKTTVKEAVMDTPVFAKNTPDAIKKAYKIKGFDAETGIMTLELVNPSALVLNKKYTLNFEVKYINQMENTTGNTFKLNVTVRK